MTDPRYLLASDVRREIVEALASLPSEATADEPRSRADGLSAAELAEKVSLHVTTVRFHLDQLVGAGLLNTRSERSASAGRPRKYYALATPAHRSGGAGSEPYRLLAELLITTIMAGGDPNLPDVAGYQWGRRRAIVAGIQNEPPSTSPGAWLSKVGRLMDALIDWGYTGSVRTTNNGRTAQVVVEHCPIRDLTRQAPGILCGLHRGAMRGTLEAFGETGAEVSVNPTYAPGLCMAQLTTPAEFGARKGDT
ncbi:MAG: helix-turn-helix domain-containing protein [Propionibacteriaceae bacterium]|nr:helix-turn-helix domain-containing protein [Micropruina sp.]